MKTNATRNEIEQAIELVNEKHGYKIIFRRADQTGKWFNFTIRSEKSGIPGSRVSHSGRKLISASWHAHGYLFEELFKLNSQAVIYSNGQKITSEEGNWQNKNIGSNYSPCYFSETSIL